MKIRSLGLKISLIVSLMFAVIIVLSVFIVTNQTNALVTELTREEARVANHAFAQAVEGYMAEALTRANMIASSNYVLESLLSGNLSDLEAAVAVFNPGLDLITVVDAEGNVIMRTHNDKKGDNLSSQKALSAALTTGKGISIIERGSTVGITTAGTAAIKDKDGKIIAAVKCGHDLSLTKYVDEIKASSNCEVTIFDGDTRMNTTLINEKGERVVGTQASDAVIEAVLKQKQNFTTQLPLFGHEYTVYYSPLIIDGEVIGMLFAGVNIDNTLSNAQAMTRQVIMVTVIAGVVCVLLIFVISLFMINRPLKKIGEFASKIERGDLGLSVATNPKTGVRSSDEIGVLSLRLEQAYEKLQGYIGEIKDRMQGLVDGDLQTTSNFDFSGDYALIKDSINLIVSNLNETMTEIKGSTAQVHTGAKQIADGSQALAQGSTQQAASVQELSASIVEIAEKTKANAEMASKAAILAGTIKNDAEKGSRQMDEMMTAVKDINQASQQISKVIKVIDDIAFQTNILALNAAVEAARAGQHGKGFAVVAEEVRNLASKSAEAAKETGNLIVNSTEKAELGSRIAGETAQSLSGIVEGINESNALITQIAQSSDEQTQGIIQINKGIDQVAQVVQQNSATAEESAAAAEEMSGQSAVLDELIAFFRLQDGGRQHGRIEMPRPAPGAALPGPARPKTGGEFGKY